MVCHVCEAFSFIFNFACWDKLTCSGQCCCGYSIIPTGICLCLCVGGCKPFCVARSRKRHLLHDMNLALAFRVSLLPACLLQFPEQSEWVHYSFFQDEPGPDCSSHESPRGREQDGDWGWWSVLALCKGRNTLTIPCRLCKDTISGGVLQVAYWRKCELLIWQYRQEKLHSEALEAIAKALSIVPALRTQVMSRWVKTKKEVTYPALAKR